VTGAHTLSHTHTEVVHMGLHNGVKTVGHITKLSKLQSPNTTMHTKGKVNTQIHS